MLRPVNILFDAEIAVHYGHALLDAVDHDRELTLPRAIDLRTRYRVSAMDAGSRAGAYWQLEAQNYPR